MKKVIFTASILIVLLGAMAATAYADTTYSVYIMDPPSNGAYGVSSSGHWIGQIPIQITQGSQTATTTSFCMQSENIIYIGSTYTATLTQVPDNAAWRAISYLITWCNPSDNNEAAAEQVAVWRLLNSSYQRESWVDVNIDNAGAALASQVSGKDVARQGDTLNWIYPITTDGGSVNGSPGQAIEFTAQLKDSTGTPRPNVKTEFAATLNDGSSSTPLSSAYVSPTEAFTDSQGMVQVTVTVPSDAPLGSTVQVQVSTHGVWPQRYVDLSDPSNQDLLALGSSFDLTTSSNIVILGYITVLPESALGALSAVAAFAASFIVWIKVLKPRFQQRTLP